MKLVIFQRFVRLRLLSNKNINNDIIKIESIINNITSVLDTYYKNNTISCENVTIYTMKLEEINNLFNSIDKPYRIKKQATKHVRETLTIIIKQLRILTESTGSVYFSDIIYLLTGSKHLDDYLDIVNRIYTPIKYKIYKLNTKYNFKNKKDCIELYDQKNIKKYNTPIFLEMYKEKNIHDIVFGSRYYYFINKNNTVLVCDGYFRDDPFHIYKKKYFIDKFNSMKSLPKSSKSSQIFYHKYINQLSLKEFIVYDNKTIHTHNNEIYNLFLKIKTETISSMVKMFLSSTPYKQRKILITLLLDTDNKHFNYLSFLLFDLINNDSFILKATPVSEEIYNSFHWNIKKYFRTNFSRYNKDYSGKTFEENDIPYEKRIHLMKTDDSVKAKAFSKLKEVENNRSDSSKSLQYLDGILKIPFGIFRKERIFGCLQEIIEKCNDYKDKIEFVHTHEIKTRNDVIVFLECYDKFNNIKINNSINTKLNNLNYSTFKITELHEIIKKMNILMDSTISLKKEKKKIYFSKLIKKIVQTENINHKILIAPLFGIDIEHETSDINLLKNNWDNYNKKIKDYIDLSSKILDRAIYKQDAAKTEIIRIIGQWINGNMSGYCLGFEGPPGVGKTTLAQKGISKCLSDTNGTRPFSFIQMGGTSNGSILEGHGYTYQGSKWGKLVDILMDSKCMNPIIYIDELDKISNTENGKELIGILTHITDRSQNKEFEDKYFSGIKIDLSKILFIFSYNDPSLIDNIFMDRIHRIKFSSLTQSNKIYIIKHYSLNEILEDIGINRNNIIFPEEVIVYIIQNYTNESGIRKLKEKIYEIVREINIRNLQHKISYPVHVDKHFVQEIFKNNSIITHKKIHKIPQIGLVNGLYATKYGLGGITLIEIFKTLSDNHLALKLTGQQGDVMKESMTCSRTLAWNIIPDSIKQKIQEEGKINKWGIHIHCPDTSTPKDGPSAGAAITLCLISLLTNIPVLNTVALTGEIDLNGNINQIGGLDSKIEGGKNAGVKLILYPESNSHDIEIIRNTEPQILENIEIKPVSNIWQVLELCLAKNSVNFNRFSYQ